MVHSNAYLFPYPIEDYLLSHYLHEQLEFLLWNISFQGRENQ